MRSFPAPDARVALIAPNPPLLFQQMATSAVTSLGAEPLYVHHENYGAMLQCIANWLEDHGHCDAADAIRVEALHATDGP